MERSPAYVVVGAYGGIGACLARSLRSDGARLLLVGRDQTRLEQLASELDSPYYVADARVFSHMQAALEQAVEQLGGCDGVANCVGSVFLRAAGRTTPEQLQDVLETNLVSAFAVVHAAANVMKDGGSVVLTSTAAAEIGVPNHEAIAAAKMGVVGLARAAAASYARHHLRINAVAPGMVETPATEQLRANEAARKASLSMHPLGRLGQPADIARAMAFLLDPQNDWITGQVLTVDGGLSGIKSPRRQ